MKLVVQKTPRIHGETDVPSSKSHTIRALVFASLAEGNSRLKNILESEDTKATINACLALGAEINRKKIGEYEVLGFNGKPNVKNNLINTLNSGTTTNFIMSMAALSNEKIIIDGDESIRKRLVEPLLSALRNLGAKAFSINNNGCPPLEIRGEMEGGKIELDCRSSQYLSSLLISCPLLRKDTEIKVLNPCELPYIDMTLRWLNELGIRYQNKDYKKITINGRQKYFAFEKKIPSDWSSATFLLVAAAMLGKRTTIKGLDLKDTQADKDVLNYLRKMGAHIQIKDNRIIMSKSRLHGCELDLNNTPDTLPAMAVIGCYAEGKTCIKNVVHARIKETDRIRVMTEELSKMRAKIQETDDGMIIEHSNLIGADLNGHYDHRIVMALSLAGMIAEGKTKIETAEAIKVTFPNYLEVMMNLGAKMHFEA